MKMSAAGKNTKESKTLKAESDRMAEEISAELEAMAESLASEIESDTDSKIRYRPTENRTECCRTVC